MKIRSFVAMRRNGRTETWRS